MSVGRTIVVCDYDPEWPRWFETICKRLWPAVEAVALRIDHVGSTSVPGLAAKPIIDMDIVVASENEVRHVIERLAAVGYAWGGDLDVAGREAFNPVRGRGAAGAQPLPRRREQQGSPEPLAATRRFARRRRGPRALRGAQAAERRTRPRRSGRLRRPEGRAGRRTPQSGARRAGAVAGNVLAARRRLARRGAERRVRRARPRREP